MYKIICKTLLFIFALSGFFMSAGFANLPPDPSATLAPMLQKILPAVVNIRAQIKVTDLATLIQLQKERGIKNGDVPDKLLSVASGVIIDANKGYLLTNAHAVDGAQTIMVTLGDNRHFTAKLIGIDKPSDIAVLQIQAKNLTAIPISDSNLVKVGDFVAAIGNPFGLSQTVTSGIVSAVGRTTGIESFENFIQTDASINPGNSGGALVNINGQLIGLNTAILAPNRGSVGIGFAIPSNMAKSIMQQIITFGNVRRGTLGIGAQNITPDLASAFKLANSDGAVVTQVLPNSPADKSGVQVGDIITTVNGTPVKNANDVVNSIGTLRVDSKTTLNLLRNNQPLSLSVTLTDPGKRKEISAQTDPFLNGLALKNFSILSPVQGQIKGVAVIAVEEDTNAWRADLMPGDIITSANQQKVTSVDELKKIAADAKETLVINVFRGAGAVFLVINKTQ